MRDERYYANKGSSRAPKDGRLRYMPNHGTPQRASTIRRLTAQEYMGLSPLRKEHYIASSGVVLHPTKGFRRYSARDHQTAKLTKEQWLALDREALAKRKEPVRDEFALVVESMTNWQRKQWAGKGYPGQSKREVEKVRHFAELQRRAA